MARSCVVQASGGTFRSVVQRVWEAILSVWWNGSRTTGRTLRVVRTTQAVRIDSERWLVALFVLVFAAGLVLAAVQTAQLGLARSLGG